MVSTDDLTLARQALEAYGLVPPGTRVEVEALVGGVSSEVYRARIGERCVVLKRALPQLRVASEWYADVRRSEVEARFAVLMSELVRESVPRPIHVDVKGHAFVMECAPDGSETWKTQLMRGQLSQATAGRIGRLLGRMHRLTANRPDVARRFADRTIFDQLRVDPYLRSTANRHPDHSDELLELADDLLERGDCLVHGDFSPKNLLVSPNGRVILVDHEVAHWGDAAFDLGFALSHLCLKAIHMPSASAGLAALGRSLVDTYVSEAGVVGAAALERTPRLVAALALARVDGKSPAEYLDGRGQDHARQLARRILKEPAPTVEGLWTATLELAR